MNTQRVILASLLLSVWLAVASAAPATEPSVAPRSAPTTAPSDDAPIVFNEDAGGAAPGDTARVGGGARGENDGPDVFLLVSRRVGRTVQDQPTIFWYLTGPTESDVDLVVSRQGQDEPVYRKRLQNEKEVGAGLHTFPLAGTDLHLETGTLYQVSVTVWGDPDDPSRNPVSTGFLVRVPPPAGVAAVGGGEPDARACAAAGLWYDALDALAREIDRRPADPGPRRRRVALLRDQHVFLTFEPKAAWERIAGVRVAADRAEKLEKERLDELARQDEREGAAASGRRP